MTVVTSYEPGEPCWVAVSSASLDRAEFFYCRLFGWTCAAVADATGYAVFELDGCAVAGAEPSPASDATWRTYFASNDLEGTAGRIRDAGGRLVEEAGDLSGLARTCVATDPTGGVFGVWEGGAHGSVIVDEPASVTWNELRTQDAGAAVAFYTAAFGWRPEPREEPFAAYHVMRAGSRSCGIWQAEGPPRWDVYFAVEDAERTAAEAAELGGDAVAPARDTPYGRTAVLRDPLGASFAVIELAEASVA